MSGRQLLALIFCLAATNVLPAETFKLRSGGQIKGRLLNADETPRRTYHVRLETGGDVTLDVADVKKVVEPTPQQRQYADLLEKMPSDTADMHWKMAEACLRWNLSRERNFHLERAIELDTNHEKARRALKYRKQADGTWARLEEIKQAAGLVRHDGKWMTPAQAKIAEAANARKQTQIEWKRNLRMWRGWLKKDSRRKEKALEEIQAIVDPLAADPLVEMFWSEKNLNMRQLLAEVLGRLNSGVAVGALAKAAMFGDTDNENEIRLYAIKQLKKNNRTSVVPAFVAELRSSSNVRVRRAAYALRELGDESVVLPLIKALRTKHTQLVGGAGNGNINANRNGGLSVGRTKPKKVDRWRDNREVLSALVHLTGVDFHNPNGSAGYASAQREWLDWYLAKTTPPGDLRRDP